MWDKLKGDNKPKTGWHRWADIDIDVIKTAVQPTMHKFREQYMQRIHDAMSIPEDKLK